MTGDPECQPTTEHTPTPWVADPDWREGYSWNIHILEAANPTMRICFMTSDGPAQANADLIVEAVNNHASLKARIEELEGHLRTAIRQWEMYADVCERPDDDGFNLSDEKSPEADLFRAARAALNPKGAE